MKKVLLLLLLFPATVNCQISQNVFPKIGYYDYYWLYKQLVKKGLNPSHIVNSNYYFDKMSELGLTHLVSYGDEISLNNTYGLKIIDDNMSWWACYFQDKYPADICFYPYYYCHATGNENNSLPYEVGGDKASTTSPNDNWGFGADNTNFISRYYLCNPDTNPNPIIINYNYSDGTAPSNIHVFRAVQGPSPQHSGIFLTADLRPSHQPYSKIISWDPFIAYYINIKSRIAFHGNLADTIAKVRIYEANISTFPAISEGVSPKYPDIRGSQVLDNLTDVTYAIYDSDFVGTDYTDIVKGPFNKKGDTKTYFKVEISWMNTQTLLVDKFSVYDSCYKNLFLSNPTITSFWKDNIKNQLSNYFGGVYNYQNYAHLYIDEPELLMNRAFKLVSDTSNSILKGRYVNGCNLSYSEADYQTENFLRRPPYVSMDDYPFKRNNEHPTASDIQMELDWLIDHPDSHRGMRATIQWAQNFNNETNNTSDDIPYYQVIQVNASMENPHSYNEKRLPTKEQILVQGNLAICYGAKGIMYWHIYTLADSRGCYWGKEWGLFDDSTTPFTGDTTVTQLIENAVTPNNRYTAVKELNESIDKIAPDLLQLTWKYGYSMNKVDLDTVTITNKYITDVISIPYEGAPQATDLGVTWQDEFTQDTVNSGRGGGNENTVSPDDPTETYVELGEFKKTAAYTSDDLEYFFLVNRRCVSTDKRIIRIRLDKSNSIFDNWGIKEIGTANKWTMNKSAYFRDYLLPGTGKLYKLSPVSIGGGRIDFNETISGTSTLLDTMIIKSGSTLTITGTYNANANIIIEPGGNIIVAPGGHLNFASGCSLIYTCPQITLHALIEGFYNGTTMIPDTVTAELHNAVSPYSLLASNKGVLDSTGYGTFFFTSAANDTSYYIVIKHRNSIETWSASPHYFTSDTLTYDFTTDSTKAYGNNMIKKNGKWCLYSGDVNQDGLIDSGDLGLVDADVSNYGAGYVSTDVNGDEMVDSSDSAIVDNNNANYVGKIVPAGAAAKVVRHFNHQRKIIITNQQ